MMMTSITEATCERLNGNVWLAFHHHFSLRFFPMSKTRFDALDVTAMVACLQQQQLGHRVVNIYDDPENPNIYILKLEGNRFLLLESGIRLHTTSQRNTNNSMPSPFCSKLRKHLRGLRLEAIKQLQGDRVVLLQFGVGASKHALVLELYAKGNLVLCQGETYTIQALLRSHVYQIDDKTVSVQVGHTYPVTYATSSNDDEDKGLLILPADEGLEWIRTQAKEAPVPKKKKNKGGLTLKTLLLKPASGVYHYGPTLLEHCVLQANLKPHEILTPDSLSTEEVTALIASLKETAPIVMKNLESPDAKGYVLYRDRPKKKEAESTPELPHADKELLEFQPHLLQQHANQPSITYDSFDAAVSDFYLHLGSQKQSLKVAAAQEAAARKLEKVRQGQADRLQQLQQDQDTMHRNAAAVQQNAERVEQALAVVNSAVDSGMDWDQLQEVVRIEQQQQNPVALLIAKLHLDQDAMTLKLPDEDGEEILVKVSLKESAHANANTLFAKYRASKEKAQKTIDNSAKALKAAEESAKKQLEQAQLKSTRTTTLIKRKPAWFERFLWFITSDNYLVLAGRDAHQNEMLVKRYLRFGDAYLHADVHGAASCVLRAKRRRLPSGKTQTIPLSERALQEAGNFCICRSSAWAKKIVLSAWWVESHQVSKTAPTGEFLTVGSFMIRGKKNFLPRCQLEMGLAVLFRLGDEDSIARHAKERRDFALMELESMEPEEEREAPKPPKKEKPVKPPKDIDALPPDKVAVSSTSVIEADLVVEDDKSKTEDNDPNPAAEEDANDDAAWVEDAPAPSPKKKGLSVKDRKLIKKYGSLEEAHRILAERDSRAAEEQSQEDTQSLSTKSETAIVKAKRGKKSKAKRAQRKYADQDDEDRELAMMALQGGEKIKKSKEDRKKEQLTKTEEEEDAAAATMAMLTKDAEQMAEKFSQQVRETLEQCVMVVSGEVTAVKWNKFDGDTLEQFLELSEEAQLAGAMRLLNLKQSTRVDNFSASLGGIIRTINKYGYEGLNQADDAAGTGRKSKDERNAEDTDWKQAMKEEGVVDDDMEDDNVDDTSELDKLTGKPVPEDALLGVVPVCAPYHTLSQYAYKVKLTPGNMKRGKAAKQCLEMFLHDDNKKTQPNHAQYKELIKRVPDNDWLQTICADVKIAAAGASKMVKKGKKNKKK